jgi:uridine kinase
MLIGITGHKGSGKDTVAGMMPDHCIIKSFSEPLKSALQTIFMFTDEQLYRKEKEIPDPKWFGCTPRSAMQYIGTELLRDQLDKRILLKT